jgi:protein phosphatase 1L
VETYKQTDLEYLSAEHSQHRDAGSTASTAVLVGERLLVANVGDSRAVISRGGKGKFYIFTMEERERD